MFLPDNIDLGHSERYILSIRINPDGFMFSISDPENGKNYCLRETTFSTTDDLLSNIQRIIFDLNFLTQEFKQTNVVFVSKKYDLVPAAFYDSKHQKELYDFSHFEKSSHLLSGLIDKQDIILLYDADDKIVNFLSRNLWSPQFFHHSHLTINMLEERGLVAGRTAKMFINLHGKYMDIICFRDAKLLHSITYESEPLTNQLYYILKMWEQCEFDQIEDYAYIAGDTDAAIKNKLSEYIKNINTINAPSEIHFWNEDANRAPLDLLTLAL